MEQWQVRERGAQGSGEYCEGEVFTSIFLCPGTRPSGEALGGVIERRAPKIQGIQLGQVFR